MKEVFIWLAAIFFLIFCFRGLFLLMMMDTMLSSPARSWWWLFFWIVAAVACGVVAINVS